MCVQYLMVTVIAIGLLCSITFHVGLREAGSSVELFVDPMERKSMQWYDWLKEHQFYLVT